MPDDLDPFAIDHLGIDLWRAEGAWRSEMLRRLGQAGYGDITAADSDILALIGPGGIRLGDLARRRGVSKQAAQEKVQALCERGYLTIGADPDDRRARRIAHAPRGLAMMQALAGVKRALQAEAEARLGATGMAALRSALAALRWPGDEPPEASGGGR